MRVFLYDAESRDHHLGLDEVDVGGLHGHQLLWIDVSDLDSVEGAVVGRMLGRHRREGPLDELTPRERDVLAAMAEGKSNKGIADELVVTEAAIEKHVTRIFTKLGLGPTGTEHRRVLAVLTYLRGSSN